MVIADFNIVCLNQKHEDIFDNDVIKCDSTNLNKGKIYTYVGWDFLKCLKGYLYEIYPKARDDANYGYDQEFFDFNHIDKEYDDKITALCEKRGQLLCVKKSEEDVIKIVDYYLDKSPVNRICFMVRIQDKEEEAVLGTMSRNEFVSRLKDGDLRFNVAYIVSLN